MSDELLWSCNEDEERLTHYDQDDAIEEYLDNLYPDPLPDGDIEVYGFAPREVDEKRIKAEAFDLMERLHERLDEDYGDPDGDGFIVINAQLAAAEAFVRAFLKDYKVWAVRRVTTETVNVREWVEKNNPDWLTPESEERRQVALAREAKLKERA